MFSTVSEGLAEVKAARERFEAHAEGEDHDALMTFIESRNGWNWEQRVDETLQRLHLDPDLAISGLSGTYAQKSATWATGVDYVVDERVINSGTSASTTAHTSGASFDAGNFTAIAT